MNWDTYFYKICDAVSENSKCLSRKIGSIIVRDKSIVSTGYNGPARSVSHCPLRPGDPVLLEDLQRNSARLVPDRCPRQSIGYGSGEGLHLCIAAHAEVNAIANAARLGVSTENCILYLNTQMPCKNCMNTIINAGIYMIVCTNITPYDQLGEWIAYEASITIRTFDLEEEVFKDGTQKI